MPALKNTKHERFAQELAKAKSQTDAYQSAGYKPSRSAAARLASDVNICARVAEIQERGAVRSEVTIASLTERLVRLADAGEELGEAPGLQASRAAVMDIAKLNGLVIDKSQVDAAVQISEIRRKIVRA